MIGMVTTTSKEVEQKLIANEANMTAFNLSLQGASAFSAQSRPSRANFQRSQPQRTFTQQSYQPPPNRQSQFAPPQRNNRNNTRPQYSCNNCGRQGHSAARCFAPGGGLARQPTSFQHTPSPAAPQTTQSSFLPSNYHSSRNQPQSTAYMQQNQNGGNYAAHLANIPSRNIIMMAKIIELPSPIEHVSADDSLTSPHNDSDIHLSMKTSALSAVHDQSHIWLVDSAASSHLCGDIQLFDNLYSIPPLSIETASGDSFTATQRGTIFLTLFSDNSTGLQDVALTLKDVIYAPKLNANLLSVGRMTNANVDVMFSKEFSALSLDGEIIARGPKINILFVYTARSIPSSGSIPPVFETASFVSEPTDITLWHHRLAHTGHSTIEKMVRQLSVEGLDVDISTPPLSQCINCPFGKQTRGPFPNTQDLPSK